jgi:hypothetical protein
MNKSSIRNRRCQVCNQKVMLTTTISDFSYEVLLERPVAITENLMKEIVQSKVN